MAYFIDPAREAPFPYIYIVLTKESLFYKKFPLISPPSLALNGRKSLDKNEIKFSDQARAAISETPTVETLYIGIAKASNVPSYSESVRIKDMQDMIRNYHFSSYSSETGKLVALSLAYFDIHKNIQTFKEKDLIVLMVPPSEAKSKYVLVLKAEKKKLRVDIVSTDEKLEPDQWVIFYPNGFTMASLLY